MRAIERNEYPANRTHPALAGMRAIPQGVLGGVRAQMGKLK
jgi:hypothetical protein